MRQRASAVLTARASRVRPPAAALSSQSLRPSVAVARPPARVTAAAPDIYTPTEQHGALRSMVRDFAEAEVEPQVRSPAFSSADATPGLHTHARSRAHARARARARTRPPRPLSLQALAHNRSETFNEPLFRKLGDLGLLGLTVAEEFGGAGADATAVAIVHEELAARDPAFTLSYLAHSLLFANNLQTSGSDAQRAAYLPRACTGELLGGMCMSEPGAGTDVLAMATTAVPVDGGAAWELTGTKTWITNGARDARTLGDVFLVYARTPPAPHGGAPPSAVRAHSVFLVERGMPGFSLGSLLKDKCGMRASPTAELVFDRVRVPAATHLVGPPGGAVASMMRNLEVERLGLAAMSLGIARRCIEVMNGYAKQRTSFGAPLNKHGQIQRHIADSYAEYAAGRAYVYACAARLDLASSGNRLDSDGVKLYASTMATAVANRAIQVLGGALCVRGEEGRMGRHAPFAAS